MSPRRRELLSWLMTAALAAAACGTPPDKEMQQAQGAIDTARAAGAEQYARDEFAAAEGALKRSHEAVEQRDYRLALNNALDARDRAQNAARQTADRKVAARADAERELLDAMTALTDANAKLRSADDARVPARTLGPHRRVITDSEAALQKTRAAFDKGDYLPVIEQARATTARLRQTSKDLQAVAAAPKPSPRRRR